MILFDPFSFLCVLIRANVFLLVLLGPFVSFWVLMGPYAFLCVVWVLICTYASLCFLMGFFKSICVLICPYVP